MTSNMIEAADFSPSWRRYAEQVAGVPPPPSWAAADIAAWVEAETATTDDALATRLASLRQVLWRDCLVAECAGTDAAETSAAFTAFAEAALHRSFAAGTDAGAQPDSGLTVFALGRLGGQELGPACDADLVFVLAGQGDGVSPSPSFDVSRHAARVARTVDTLAGRDGDFALRVYRGCQPDECGQGPLCDDVDFERHLASRAGTAERFTWLRARVLSGADDLMREIVAPFVFRRYCDYTVFESLRAIHGQLRREIRQAGLEDNIRHGPGGLREIEFLVQAFQLMRGGRDSRLRHGAVGKVLDEMRHRRELPGETVDELARAHAFLRRLEHALQYVDDSLQHRLPAETATRERIARFMGFVNIADFTAVLAEHRDAVSRQFEAASMAGDAAEAESVAVSLWPPDLPGAAQIDEMARRGFAEPAAAHALLCAYGADARYRELAYRSREHFDRTIPKMLHALGGRAGENDGAAVKRCLDAALAIARQPAYLALLAEHPGVVAQLVRFCAPSPWVAEYLTRHAWLVDELLCPEDLLAPADPAALARALTLQLDKEAPGDAARQLLLMNEFRQSQTFRIIARELMLGLAPAALGHELSQLADILLAEAVRRVWGASLRKHRDAPAFAIVAYGKLGARELGYASDLDLVFLYRDEHPDAQENYSRFAKRLTAWLGTATPAGTLYEIDLRLRPDGDSGLAVCSLDAFADYQGGRAWLWEHQALTRARFCVGDADLGAAFETVRRDILCRRRDPVAVAAEVGAMRQRMREGHPNEGPDFDLKHDAGGMVDVEFAVQALILARAADHAELAEDIGNRELLRRAGAAGLVPAPLADAAGAAYERYRQLQHALRLQGRDKARLPHARVGDEIAAVRALWTAVFV